LSYFRNQLEDWLKTIDVKADKVLDVGGGSNPVKGRTKSWDVKQYLILDNELEDMKQKPDIVGDIQDTMVVSQIIPELYISPPPEEIYKEKQFDIIFCLEVAEYLWEPWRALCNMYDLLKKGGILYISFPFIYPHHAPEGHDYLRYTRWGALKLLEEAGFKIKSEFPRVQNDEVHGYGQRIQDWFSREGMHPSRSYPWHNEIGYLFEAVKK